MTPQRPSPLTVKSYQEVKTASALCVWCTKTVLYSEVICIVSSDSYRGWGGGGNSTQRSNMKIPCTRPSSVVRDMSMEGTHHLPTLYNAMQCSVRRAPGNMSMEGTHPLPTLYNVMQCSVRRAPGNMSMEGTHPLPTLYNAMQCSVRRAPGNMSMEGTHHLHTLYNGCFFSYLKPSPSMSQPTCKALTHVNGYTILTFSGFDVHHHLLQCCFLFPPQKLPSQILP